MQIKQKQPKEAIRLHRQLLGHEGYGVTELRIFKPKPFVAYTDNDQAAIDLAVKAGRFANGIYIGVQPRPLTLFDKVPNCWKPAYSNSNCACDRDIEYITAVFFEISRLDIFCYNFEHTQQLIERVQKKGYSPTNCKTIQNYGFHCSAIGKCQANAPAYSQ